MILVTGATGTVGREVVSQLVAGGQPTRALTRDPSRARFGPSVEVAVGDLGKPESLVSAMRDVAAVFSVARGSEIPWHESNLAKAAKQAGVKRIVKLSVLGAGSGQENAVLRWHEAGERALQDSGVPWTFVRPGSFMSNALGWAGSVKGMGNIFAPYGEGKLPVIHPRDIASVAVKALVGPGHEGKAYALTGPEALSVGEQAQILSAATGRSILYVPIADDVAREGMIKGGMAPALVEALLQMAAGVRGGELAQVLPTLEQVLGRKGLTFADWAKENAAAFR